MRCFTLPIAVLVAAAAVVTAATAEDWVSASPPQTGLIYDVYAPLYGRSLAEVKRDLNFAGGPLTVDGRRYDRGFGCRGFSVIELAVPAGVTALGTVLGIDDTSSGNAAGTYFSVWGNGRRLWQSPALGGPDSALEVTVPVAGLSAVKLITDAQGYGNRDLADWCDTRWLRDQPPPRPLWSWRPAPSAWYLRADLHPFNLAYRGEPVLLSALGPTPAAARLTWTVRTPDGQQVLTQAQEVPLQASEASGAAAALPLSLGALPNGLYDLALQLASAGRTVAERTYRLGLLPSRLGTPSEGTIFGVNHHEFVASYEALAAIGCEYSRQWFCWAWIEPRPGEWHWSWHDERVAEARRLGLKTIGVLGGIGQPAWSSPANVQPGQTTTHGFPADLQAWEDYVRAVATRYKGRITVWESWNEVMGAAQGGREGWSVAGYVDLHRRTQRVLREVDPGNRLLLSADGLQFVQQCLDAGLGNSFEGLVPHPYRPGSSPEAVISNPCVGGTGDLAGVFTTERSWLDRRGFPRAGVWATEIGWAVSGNGWVTVPLQTHGEYVPRSYQLALASGQCANLCWHDFAHSMFGLADPTGVPRPALLSYAATVPRLAGAVLMKRLPTEGQTRVLLFQRGDTEMLTLCAEQGQAFALLKPPAALRLRALDWYGNESTLSLPPEGRALPLDGRLLYVEGPDLAAVQVSAVQPLQLTPSRCEALPGSTVQWACEVANVFGEAAVFRAAPAPVAGLQFAPAEALELAPGQRGQLRLSATVNRDAAPGPREVAVSFAVPGPLTPTLPLLVDLLPAVSASLRPCTPPRPGAPVAAQVELRNADQAPLHGEVALAATEGLSATPALLPFAEIPRGGTAALDFTLAATRPLTSADTLEIRVRCSDGAHSERRYSLLPTVQDSDGDGLADGWKLNPEGGPPERRNQATAAIEAGDSEFSCQRITCSRFGGGWIILHRDGQDRVSAGRRYRATFRGRAEGLRGTVGVAVYNLTPWQSCGLESHYRLGPAWQAVTADFTAARDSDNVRFEVYFTEVGTVWLEGLRLEQLP